jgi:hypothetical protein
MLRKIFEFWGIETVMRGAVNGTSRQAAASGHLRPGDIDGMSAIALIATDLLR